MNKDQKWLCWRSLSAFVHLAGAVIYAGSLIFIKVTIHERQDPNLANATEGRFFAGHWKYLTHWDHVLQCITFALCVIVDGINFYNYRKSSSSGAKTAGEPNHPLQRFTDFLCHSLAFPVGLFVMFLFWSLYFIDSELVMPRGAQAKAWLNHLQHSVVGVLIVLEHFLCHHKRPKWKFGLPPLIFFVVLYNILVHYIGFVKHYWVYAILGDLSWPLRVLFVMGCVAFIITLYSIGGLIYRKFWTPKRKAQFFDGFGRLNDDVGMQNSDSNDDI